MKQEYDWQFVLTQTNRTVQKFVIHGDEKHARKLAKHHRGRAEIAEVKIWKL